jgi:hypothetical protein
MSAESIVPVTEKLPSSYLAEKVPFAVAFQIYPAQLNGLNGSCVSGTTCVGVPDFT